MEKNVAITHYLKVERKDRIQLLKSHQNSSEILHGNKIISIMHGLRVERKDRIQLIKSCKNSTDFFNGK